MLNQIADAINTYIQKYNEVKQFSMIISTQGDILAAPVVTADPELDITDELIAGLNEEYIKTKNNTK
jgi:Skp family chaperone for outer membrane proteins